MADLLHFAFRRARVEDLARVSRLEKQVWRALSASYEEIERRFLHFPQAFQIAVASAEIAGFCCALLSDCDARDANLDETFPDRHHPGGRYFILLALTVNPIFRRLGVASTLVKRELAFARELSCRKVQLIANTFSQPLFEKYYFKSVRGLSRLYKQYRELMPTPVLMELTLE